MTIPDPAPSSRNVVKNPRLKDSVVIDTTHGLISSTTSAIDGIPRNPVSGVSEITGSELPIVGTGIAVGGIGVIVGKGSEGSSSTGSLKPQAPTTVASPIKTPVRVMNPKVL
tara:strand:+ start:60 stop:395 length:336 start_codon:yes stop_codon:yes gene_type:complete